MQTLYYTTGNFIRHTGNVVDLTEYRRRLAQAQQEPEEGEEKLVLLPRESAPSPRRSQGQKGPPPGAVSGRLRQHGGGGDDFDVYPAGAGSLNFRLKIKTLCRKLTVFYRAHSCFRGRYRPRAVLPSPVGRAVPKGGRGVRLRRLEAGQRSPLASPGDSSSG